MRYGSRIFGALAFAGATLGSTLAFSAASSAASDPRGIWFNDTGRGAIEIKSCGANLCGEVVWLKDASDQDGCGKQIIGDAKPSGDSTWDGGWIYSPEKKKTYDVELTPIDDTQLRVKGYAGTKLFSKTMIWTRAPDNLVRCKKDEVASATPAAPVASTPAKPVSEPSKSAALSNEAKPEAKPEQKMEQKPGTAAAAEAKPAPKIDHNTDVAELSDALGDVFSKNGDRCKLDLPWVKLNFTCDGK